MANISDGSAHQLDLVTPWQQESWQQSSGDGHGFRGDGQGLPRGWQLGGGLARLGSQLGLRVTVVARGRSTRLGPSRLGSCSGRWPGGTAVLCLAAAASQAAATKTGRRPGLGVKAGGLRARLSSTWWQARLGSACSWQQQGGAGVALAVLPCSACGSSQLLRQEPRQQGVW